MGKLEENADLEDEVDAFGAIAALVGWFETGENGRGEKQLVFGEDPL